jgi:putative ABC transport system permease protein
MRSLRAWLARFAGQFDKARSDAELADELESHLQLHIEDNLRAGMTAEQARRHALIKLGGLDQTKEACRDRRGIPWLDSLLQDARFGLRLLRKNLGFTVVAVATLALGIGANTAIFSVVNAVLLRTLPFSQRDRILSLHVRLPDFSYELPFNAPNYRAFGEQQRSFETMAIYSDQYSELSGAGAPERVETLRSSATLFPLLGVAPMLGRSFTAEEDQPGYRVAILSYGLWQRRYGGDPKIIGRTIELDRDPYTVIGVMPNSFQFPIRGPKFNSEPAEVLVPMAFTPAELQGWLNMYNHSVLGLLKSGVTIAQAQSDAENVIAQTQKLWPPTLTQVMGGGRLGATVRPYQDEVVGDVRAPLLLLLGAVGLVLLIACANVANLLLARASVRQKEMVIRAALGAGRGRLIRQMLVESLLLAMAAGTAGVLIAFGGMRVLRSLAPATLPRIETISLDNHVLAFAFALSILTAVVFGLIPAVEAAGSDPQDGLRARERGTTAARGSSMAQSGLIVSQTALAVMLLILAGLLLRSFERLLETDPGFQPQHVLTMTIPLPYQAYRHADEIRGFFKEMVRRTETLPGVISVGASTDLPLKSQEHDGVQIEGREDSGTLPHVVQSWVLDDYFSTMGITLQRGRLFTPEDRLGTPDVVVISETAARTYWPGQDPLGKRMIFINGKWHVVIGIVKDVKDSAIQDPSAPHAYTPYLQIADGPLEEPLFAEVRTLHLALRTHGDPSSVVSQVLRELNSLDPSLAIAEVETAEASIQDSLAPQRFNLSLLGLFAALAIFLAAVGIYGVVSYWVAQRSHEIGVRIALGARSRDVLVLVLQKGMLLAGLGTVIGIVATFPLMRLLAGMLYGVKAADPITLASVAAILLGVALLSCYIPARRAMRVDPAVALRYE